MYIYGDFHMHTNASDGTLTPEELVREAKKSYMDIIAITDHDNTLGLKSAILEGDRINIKVIPGIELTTSHNGESIHMLGYFKDDSYENSSFQETLNEMKGFRFVRAKKIIHNLNTYFHIVLNYEKVYSQAKGVIARPHIARAIIDAGYPFTWEYIFNHILNDESPAYIPNNKINIQEGIQLLKSVNAFVVLAHPILIKKSSVEDLMRYDFDGIEAIYSQNTPENTEELTTLAKRYKKIITAGSDFHSRDIVDTKHGYIGAVRLEGVLLQEFLDSVL